MGDLNYEEQIEDLKTKWDLVDQWNPKNIPNFKNVFKICQKSLLDNKSIALLINKIYAYYPDLISLYDGHDIYQKLKVLKTEYPTDLINDLSNYRNIITHHGYLPVSLIQNLTFEILNLFEEEYYYIKLFDQFYHEWLKLYTEILSVTPDNKPTQETLLYLKENGFKDSIKGHKILILQGKHQNKIATFVGWSGSVVTIIYDESDRKTTLTINTLVELL